MDIKSKLGLKFVMSKLKRLITDETSGLRYMENLDDILKDIFGVKNFTKKLNDCYDDRESIITINEIGMKNLMSICNTQRTYSVFAELVMMNAEIHRIHRALRKAEKKGKKDKKLIKEYNYLLDTYRRAVKALRKKFNTGDKSSYKKKFRSVNDLIDSKKGFSYYDDDGSISSVLYDGEEEFYRDDDDDDDDGDGLSDFERYLKRMSNPQGSKNKKKEAPTAKSNMIDFDDDDDEDDEDDTDIDHIEEKIDDLTGKMSTLTSAIQALVNNAGSVQLQRQTKTIKSQESYDNSVNQDLGELSKSILFLAKCQKESIEKQNAILEILSEVVLPEDDEDFEDTEIKPVVVKTQSVRKTTEATLSREELINIVNNESPANIGTEQINQNDVNREPKPSNYT